jgi:hypothetical protein
VPSVRYAVRHQGVETQRHLVGRHDLLAGDIEDLGARVHRHDLDLGDVLPEGIAARRQRLDEVAVAEPDADVAGRDRDAFQRALDELRLDDDRQVRVREAHLAGVHDLRLHVVERRPVRAETRRQHVAESAVDPDQGALVVLKVEHHGPAVERTRLDDDIQLVVHQPRRTLRYEIDMGAMERHIQKHVPARFQQSAELAVAEVETNFVAVDLDELDHDEPPRSESPYPPSTGERGE